MAYVSANLNLIVSSMGDGMPSIWTYKALADAQTAVRVNNFFSDGLAKGCRSGDIVLVTYTSGAASIHAFNSVSSSSVDLTDGLAVASTDTD